MKQAFPVYQVDAFTNEVFGGNPAAVCPLDSWLADDLMQKIAAENNLSETAFFVPGKEGYHLRWFTPTHEVDLCGHATLATAHVIATELVRGTSEITFETRSGVLRVSCESDGYTLDFPARPPVDFADDGLVAAAIGVQPLSVLKSTKMLAVLADEDQVLAVAPDLVKVMALPSDGLIVTAPGKKHDFVSRYFAPHCGIPEDPVTGSAHVTLTPYWSKRLGKKEMFARQVSQRGGELWVKDCGDRVLMRGAAVLYLKGFFYI
ncbi:PhzF family phenazine biosynthesis protein [Kiloniella laminariae]|uniref:PhzF family phenazine biosynthesis protein n=1 Tax=Kiloniella laminariae TaxID=454162 RepID=A0ABT4LIN4_9PROT|nr:PhzF family phenazine biosynthesis protein [Kiloniella laminariae]MCZ4280800.1 PhzF family phenazine biosynthesis protein [Kiloniella laminariae]